MRSAAAGASARNLIERLPDGYENLLDEIHLMEDDRIVESGLDSQLIARGGRCSEWWALQKIQ